MDLAQQALAFIEGGIKFAFGWPPTPLILVALILAYAVKTFVDGKHQFAALTGDLQKLSDRLASFKSDGSAFAEGFEALNEEFRSSPHVGGAWASYADSLQFDDQLVRMKGPIPPGEFFNERLIRQGAFNFRAFEATPNQLVGIGLLATFLGLVAALFIARDGIQADLEESKNALKDLLGAAATKFITSVAALGAALVFTQRKSKLLQSVDQKLDAINRELDRLVVLVSAEQLAESCNRELALQTVQLERFNQDFAISVAKALDERLGHTFKLAIQPVQEALEKTSENMGKLNQEALATMAEEFAKTLSGAAEGHTQKLADVFERASTALAQIPGQIDEAGERFQSVVATGSDEISRSFLAAGENLDATMQKSAEISGAALRMIAAEIGAGGEAARKELETAADQLKLTFAEGAADITNSMIAAVDNLDTHIATAGQKLGHSLEAAADRIDASASSLQLVAERSEALAESFTKTGNVLASQFEALLATAREVTSSMTELMRQVSEAGLAAEKLADLADSMSRVSDKLDHAATNVGMMLDRTEALNEKAVHTVSSLVARVDTINGDLKSLNNALTNVMQKLFEGLGEFGTRTTSFVKSVDKDLSDAVSRLSAAVQQLDSVVVELPKRGDFKGLSDAISKFSSHKQAAK